MEVAKSMDEKYFTPREIAEKYRVTSQAVTKWIKQGKLKAVKLGGVWRIPESALQGFLKSSGQKK